MHGGRIGLIQFWEKAQHLVSLFRSESKGKWSEDEKIILVIEIMRIIDELFEIFSQALTMK